MNNKYLPIGSVVLLNNGQHRLMVVGFCSTDTSVSNSPVYDYIGCLYPEGIFSMEKIFAFNHSDIKLIYYLGFSDDEEKQFKEKLKNVLLKDDASSANNN